jgi:hypothetical protein
MKVNPLSASMFLFLAEHMDKGNAVACSSRVLEEAFGVSRITVWKAVKAMKESGFVHVYKMGTTNVYTLNASVVWSSWTDGREYAVFQGSILVAGSEQEKELVQQIKERKVKVVDVPPPVAETPFLPFPEAEELEQAVRASEASFTDQKPPRSGARKPRK